MNHHTPRIRKADMSPTRTHAIRTVALLAATIMPTSAVFAAEPPAYTPKAAQAMLAAASPGSRVACANDTHGNLACRIDGQAVDIDDCASNLSYGSIVADGGRHTALLDRFPAAGAGTVAELSDHQLVCLQATVRKDGQLVAALVKAVPSASVKECKDNALCRTADQPVKWVRPATGHACARDAHGMYAGDCATGWVKGDAVEEYANGLKPEDTGA